MRQSLCSAGRVVSCAAAATAALIASAWMPASAQAQEQTYTLNADFDQGVLNNVNHDAPNNDQLQLNSQSLPEPFMWIAQTNEGIIVKIDTRTGRQVGRYPSTFAADCPDCPAPDGQGRNSGWYPSRTAVDLNGDVWVANRSFGVQGSVTKIGSTPSSCVDRNGNGVIDTSHDADGDGLINMDDPAEYLGQADECLIKSIPVGVPNAVLRAIALDQDGKLWVGSYTLGQAYKVDPTTGTVLTTINLQTTPYGFVVKDNYLYSAALGQPVARANLSASPITVQLMNCPNNYGITVNRAGVAWFGNTGGGILQADFADPANGCPANGVCIESCKSFGGDSHYGLTVDGDDQIWAASPGSGEVQKYDPAGNLLGNAFTGGQPYGVAIGHDGKIWTAAWYNVSSIEPGAVGGPPGATASYSTDYPGHPSLYNYTYSDFTGFQLRNVTVQQGTWNVIKNGGRAGVPWGTLQWNQEAAGNTPPGTEITGEVRAADSTADLALQPFLAVTNNVPFTLTGQYIEIRMTLRNTNTSLNQTPILSDVTIKTSNTPPVARCAAQAVCTIPSTCGAMADINAGSSDPDGDPITLTRTPAGPYALGATPVLLTVTDTKGASSTCNAIVTVSDCEKPTITCPMAQTLECSGSRSANASVVSSATDNCSVVLPSCVPSSGAFPLGNTAATCSATDPSGNKSSCTTSVNVVDTAPPSIVLSRPQVTSTGCNVSIDLGTATTADICDPTPTVTNDAPVEFPHGATTVTWKVSDISGNTATAKQMVTVGGLPQFTSTPPDVTSTECEGRPSIGTAKAKDICGNSIPVTNNAPANFPLGTTTVVWTATDSYGGNVTYLQRVTVSGATDLGNEHQVSSIRNNACLKVTRYPSWSPYMHAVVVQAQANGVGWPIPMTFTNGSCNNSGSGTLVAPWRDTSLRPINTSCPVLIKLRGNGAGPVSLTWWGNG
jgi:large repetitive protein